jgi:hypothetical protein
MLKRIVCFYNSWHLAINAARKKNRLIAETIFDFTRTKLGVFPFLKLSLMGNIHIMKIDLEERN